MPPKKQSSADAAMQSVMLRGDSFVAQYSKPGHRRKSSALLREPTMLHDSSVLIPATDRRYTFVLDLDETVVYARDGPLHARAGLDDLLTAMDQHGEVVVWTAGTRSYAKAVMKEINTMGVIKHLIYRHKAWFNAEDYTKDLRRLGRDVHFVLIVENTPDCVRANPQNGIIVQDFEGARAGASDRTLKVLQELVCSLGESGLTVPEYLATCSSVKRQLVKGSDGHDIPIFFLSPSGRKGRKQVNRNLDKKETAEIEERPTFRRRVE
jgi:TFIIF-interacting CTD phosphatase-like protein